ncbi:MAG: gliding motility-associated ABC transporter permease subunit GldF [Flavobacteriales bacterium]|jgi:ABC-2 type transport system permease protein|nr:gliding motility-associated ABC transporter permease subunit GldF [Flavobacteriales bacterium]MBK6883908.1 gliding motility-associated ABC transporter permease subunit GldF [Flavobacteriales bacterium]MBK7100299.1 gliding motility-associated ABC transporter permease subunit GldF [Flavobacteriales bacterium]MBK7110993.1 gliding motility-associated ABC transporter permease subunit GldF [Flavobacteriales bacterium]MBK7481267.1 gliding motility-associated ABC transporter permease subunit GldF [F
MRTLIFKEVRGFLGSLIGQVVVVVFLLITGLFLWVFPNNILDTGYADLAPLFFIAPWVFLFLVPAVTMRSFSEEKRTGTIELLLTKPLTEMQLVLAKYIAAVILIVFALLPTLVYWYSLYDLAIPRGNLDTGGIIGSYIGLLSLASCFAAIGVFASSITENQVVSFMVAVFLCFILYLGFDLVASFDAFGAMEGPIRSIGIQDHYTSLSRGVVDLRDVLYFLGTITVFLLLTRTALQSRRW